MNQYESSQIHSDPETIGKSNAPWILLLHSGRLVLYIKQSTSYKGGAIRAHTQAALPPLKLLKNLNMQFGFLFLPAIQFSQKQVSCVWSRLAVNVAYWNTQNSKFAIDPWRTCVLHHGRSSEWTTDQWRSITNLIIHDSLLSLDRLPCQEHLCVSPGAKSDPYCCKTPCRCTWLCPVHWAPIEWLRNRGCKTKYFCMQFPSEGTCHTKTLNCYQVQSLT